MTNSISMAAEMKGMDTKKGLGVRAKRRAKEEILARYASFVYMGNGQYGIARAAEYYFGRPIAAFTEDDADKAALLAGIAPHLCAQR